jgi:hypothetical protein
MADEGLHRCAYCNQGFSNAEDALEHQGRCSEAPDYIRIQADSDSHGNGEARGPVQKPNFKLIGDKKEPADNARARNEIRPCLKETYREIQKAERRLRVAQRKFYELLYTLEELGLVRDIEGVTDELLDDDDLLS